MAMKVARLSLATARASSVLPVPGGPNSRMPLGGARMPYTDTRAISTAHRIAWQAAGQRHQRRRPIYVRRHQLQQRWQVAQAICALKLPRLPPGPARPGGPA